MSRIHWKERFNDGGICDFKLNYNFYFKWLLNKVCNCFYITGLPETINEYYIKSNLITDGDIGITEFNSNLYAVIGAPAGQPDEYYIPEQYVVANPRLGSKTFTRNIDGVVIYNTDIDQYVCGGLYDLISQTATLLADNIISINCNQINCRVQTIVTGEDDSQVMAAELALKKLYAGKPYTVIKSDLIDKININPVASSSHQNLTELVELHNYIIGNFFQSIGIKSNNIRKKAHVLQDEIESQDSFLQISIFEILTSWQKGFDKVNELFGTNIQVNLNPALINEIVETEYDEKTVPTISENVDLSEQTDDETELETESADEKTETNESSEAAETSNFDDVEAETDSIEESTVEQIIEQTNEVNEIVDLINDSSEAADLTESEEINYESESNCGDA